MTTATTTALTIRLPHLAPHTLEAHLRVDGTFATVDGYGVLAGRTATKVRLGSLSFRLADQDEVERWEARPEFARARHAHAVDEAGRLWVWTGVSASGNKGSAGYRVVGHTEVHGVAITTDA